MLIRDNLGYVHEIPTQLVFDGLGNPVGELGDLWDIVKSVGGAIGQAIPAIGRVVGQALPAVASAIPGVGALLPALAPAIGGLAQSLLPGQAAPSPAPPPPFAVPGALPPTPAAPWMQPPTPGLPPWMQAPPGAPVGPPFGAWPPGWVQPPIPYTGLQPRRLYLRCSTWHGPGGLVPTYAAQAQPGAAPTPLAPGATPPGTFPGWTPHRRFHHHRRR
jgi:eukaryotic-like serine/threonine-protein kinase